MGMICLDWDNTVMHGHLHSFLRNNGVKPGGMPQDLIGAMQGAGGFAAHTALTQLLTEAKSKGHDICIVTHSDYPEALSAMLQELAKASPVYSDIPIFAGFPGTDGSPVPSSDPNAIPEKTGLAGGFPEHGKRQNIAQAQAYFAKQGRTYSNADILLVDDSRTNIQLAQKDGQQTVRVRPFCGSGFDTMGFGYYPGRADNVKVLKEPDTPAWVNDMKGKIAALAVKTDDDLSVGSPDASIDSALDDLDAYAAQISSTETSPEPSPREKEANQLLDELEGNIMLDELEEQTRKQADNPIRQVSTADANRNKERLSQRATENSDEEQKSVKEKRPPRKKWGTPG